jgi:hypothetical protein
VFPEATFHAGLRKYGPPASVFTPFYSWDADMRLTMTAWRRGRQAVEADATFQTAGTENLGTTISVGGTGYLFHLAYARALSSTASWSAGAGHFSSHLTRDLDQKTGEVRRGGGAVPDIADADEYNVLFVGGSKQFSHAPFEPVVGVTLLPVAFRFGGGHAAYARPLYVSTRLMLWQRRTAALVGETRHEFGHRPWNEATLSLMLFRRQRADGPLAAFVSLSPGRSIHVSPNIGALRDGLAVGFRLTFKSGDP